MEVSNRQRLLDVIDTLSLEQLRDYFSSLMKDSVITAESVKEFVLSIPEHQIESSDYIFRKESSILEEKHIQKETYQIEKDLRPMDYLKKKNRLKSGRK